MCGPNEWKLQWIEQKDLISEDTAFRSRKSGCEKHNANIILNRAHKFYSSQHSNNLCFENEQMFS